MRKIVRELLQLFYSFYSRKKSGSVGENCRFNQLSVFNNATNIGNDCHFNGCKILGQGSVTIEDHFHSGPHLLMLTDFHDYNEGPLPYGKKLIRKEIHIEKNVWIGRNVTILGGCRIGEGAIIQAGSVVVSDIDRLSIAGGHPAKKFSSRDEENYNSRLHLK